MTPRACYACGRPIQRDPLSKVDAAVFRYVSFYLSEHGYSPTHQEVCDHLGWSSLSTANEYLGRLVDKGWLMKLDHSRGYVPIREDA